jgi:hypothetical protein
MGQVNSLFCKMKCVLTYYTYHTAGYYVDKGCCQMILEDKVTIQNLFAAYV